MAIKSSIGSSNKVMIFDPSDGSHLFTFDKNDSETVPAPVKKTGALSFTAYIDNEDLDTHFATWLTNATIESNVQRYVDSSEDQLSNTADTVPQIVAVHVGGEVNAKRKLTAILGAYTGDTGNITTAVDGLTQTPVEITGIINTGSTITIASTVLDALLTDISLTTADISIANGAMGATQFAS